MISLGRSSTILRGGLFGGKIVLKYLFTHWSILFGNMWAIPPFLRGAPASVGGGVFTSIFCGASLETALRWGIVPEMSVFPPKKASVPPRPQPQPFGLLVRGHRDGSLPEHQQAMQDQPVDGDKDKSSSKHPEFLFNEDVWSLSYPGQINLEVVIKAEHEAPASVGRIRDMFAEEIESCLHFLMNSPEWVANIVRVPVSSTSSPTDPKVFTFSVQRLLAEEGYAAAFRKKVSKVGLAFFEGAAAMVDASGNMAGGENGGIVDISSLVKLLRGIQSKSNPRNEATGGENGEAVGTEDAEEGTLGEEHIHGQQDDDPTSQDVDRIAALGVTSDKIRKGLRMKQRVYVPVNIRFSLLAVIRGLDIPSARAEKASGSFKPLLHAEQRHLTIGKSETMARLLASTVWLSPDAERGIWGCARKEESIHRCVYHEAKRYSEESKKYYATKDLVSAYEMAGAASIVGAELDAPTASSQSSTSDKWGSCIDSVPAMVRMSHGLAGRMKRVLECLQMLRWMFDTSSGVFGALNHVALAHTIVRHICLAIRMIIMAPQSVHLRSGCLLILRKVSELEQVLHLGSLDLRHGHRYSQISDKARRTEAMALSLPAALPLPVGMRTDKSTDTINAEAEFRRSLASPAMVVHKMPHRILQDTHNMCKVLYVSLADDVFQNFSESVKALVTRATESRENETSALAFAHEDASGYSGPHDLSRDASTIGKEMLTGSRFCHMSCYRCEA